MVNLRELPSINKLLNTPLMTPIIQTYGRPLSLTAMRSVLDRIREGSSEKSASLPNDEKIITQVREQLDTWLEPTLIPVINASGVILHTNLGRAPLSKATIKAIETIVNGYSNLEFNLETGKRGKRSIHASHILKLLTGCESGFVVNNNAGAVLLVLSALAKDKNVLVSRTQLVEIGGGFRIPDVMRQSGANLVEIGTTNRIHLYDFEKALQNGNIALVLVAHHSNFKLIGFHGEPHLKEIVEMSHQHKVPVVHDLGSGALLNTEDFGLAHEPTVHDSMAAGCDLVCFSGDKMLGGPQAGIIIGKEKLLKSIRIHPLARALRADKLTLAGVTATLSHYLKDEAQAQLPIWQMISRPLESIKLSAENWREYIGAGKIIPGFSTVGGGSLPTEEMPTYLLALNPPNPDAFMLALREFHPPIIARIENDQVLFDPRTVLIDQEGPLLRNLVRVLEQTVS
ncbi:MAG: L-seryl-tRNA(Sec) selenium transferase [Chloroflexota bacterium]|nr:L-seryl-tRNA(Sec) selenium transferase [Chloroflexota bacterium]